MWLYILIAILIFAAYLFIIIKSAAEKKLPEHAKKPFTDVLDWIHRNGLIGAIILIVAYSLIPIGFGHLILLGAGLVALSILMSGIVLYTYTKIKFIKSSTDPNNKIDLALSGPLIIGIFRAVSLVIGCSAIAYYLAEYIRVSKP